MPKPKTQTPQIILNNPRRVKFVQDTRSHIDGRVWVDYHVYEYLGNDGESYRKSFETKPMDTPNIPSTGTHAEINARLKQW